MKTSTLSPGKWNLTIFPKLFIALLVVVAPLYGIAIAMNQLGEASLERELSNSLEAKVDFYSNSLEVEYEHMMSLLQEHTLDKDIHHLTYLHETMSLAEFTDMIRRVQIKIEQLKGSSIYAKNVSLHILTLDRSMNSEFSITDTLINEYEAVQPLTLMNGSGLFLWQDRMFLAISHPAVHSVTVEPGFILSIELNLDAIRSALLSFQSYEDAGAMLLHMQSQAVIATRQSRNMDPIIEAFTRKNTEDERDGLERVMLDGEEFVVAYQYSESFGHYLIAYMPTKQMLGPIDTYKKWLWLLSFMAFFIIIAYSYWIYRLIHKPLQKLVKAFRRVEQMHLVTIDVPHSRDEFLYLFQRFNMMVGNLNELIKQVYEQKLRSQSTELKQLQAQINPHFLYNTYFILYRLAKMNDNESILRFSQYLGEYFQYITRTSSEQITLEMEYNHSRTYAEIQNIRFKNRIQVAFGELPEAIKSYHVPRLILQPIVENAYKYGLEKKRSQGLIQVAATVTDEAIEITVEDNGDPLPDEQIDQLQQKLRLPMHGDEMEYTGLLNVQRRLQIRFGQHYGVQVARSNLGGLRVTIRLPWPPNDTDEKGS